ncbi:MAG: AAA family ATPase [Planctomycetaceae bacterium]|uniref:ATPase family associated with various cellular activities (AAA) n=1 Tax=Lacipirellula limnantheis TaxID=2528024 RepID=A0A517U5F5_9BACT|nr:AAA family ATPase [Lacipirellula limnantheis]MBL9161977.1 AAA family ATPase [Planctomycetaceae bacterium]QDT75843.1 ATPase family associated with various cellular activities (AAA) [Lacipirellula limnantheis]
MYLDYWQLDAKPFEPGCDDRTFFRGAAFQSAINKLRYAIENNRAAGLLAGPAGVGKTLLVESLRQQLGADYQPFVRVVFPQMSDRDLLVYLAEQLGAPPADPPRHTIEESLRRLEYILADNVSRKRRAVVVVDEAHLLEDSGLLEPLRLLLNLGSSGAPPFTLLLVGQPTLGPIVQRHGGLDERVDIKVLLPALSLEETASYVTHRLEAAGATREIFAADALKTIHQLTGGIPRRINRLCDLALLVGFANGQHAIDAESLHAIHGELVTVPAAA